MTEEELLEKHPQAWWGATIEVYGEFADLIRVEVEGITYWGVETDSDPTYEYDVTSRDSAYAAWKQLVADLVGAVEPRTLVVGTCKVCGDSTAWLTGTGTEDYCAPVGSKGPQPTTPPVRLGCNGQKPGGSDESVGHHGSVCCS